MDYRSKLAALAALLGAIALASAAHAAARPAPPDRGELRRATERLLTGRDGRLPQPTYQQAAPGTGPEGRVVALYGAPQMSQTILGIRSAGGATRELAKRSEAFEALGEPVTGELDLVASFATAGPGRDGTYRLRQDPEVISLYLDRARAVQARLMLDLQPGRARLRSEVASLREWLVEPDVDLAIDPEWVVGRHGVPGRTPGKVTARQVNRAARDLASLVRREGLPPKLLVVHQFRRSMIRGRGRIRSRPGVRVVLNYDGIGSPGAKAAGYAALASGRLQNGFSLFLRRDHPLLDPEDVLALDPEPDFVLYQ